MSTGFYFIENGDKVFIDNLETAERKDHVKAVRVDNGEPVVIHILKVEVE